MLPETELELCRRLLPAIRAFAARRLRPASAEDFAQDALLVVLEARRAGNVEEPDQLASFALGVCRNLARQRARTADRRRELWERYGLAEEEQAALLRTPDFRREHLEDCYSQLTERARNVVVASFCEEDDDADIAARLELSAANVRVIRHRTLLALRSCLERPISWGHGAAS